MLKVVVVDAQGGGLGAAVVKKLNDKYSKKIHLTVVGVNSTATAAMKKIGADAWDTGEEAICLFARCADVIIGGIGIIAASGMLGEITPKMAKAISQSKAKKILIPISRCNFFIPVAEGHSITDMIDGAVAHLCTMI